MKLEVVEQVVAEPPALVLRASCAVGGAAITTISWMALRSAPIGAEWEAAGGGNLFSDDRRATLVYRDSKRAVLLEEHDYETNDRSGGIHERRLVAYSFT